MEFTYLQLGKPMTNNRPVKAEIRYNIVTPEDKAMELQLQQVREKVEFICNTSLILSDIQNTVALPAAVNAPEAEDILRTALAKHEFTDLNKPFIWKDDFGHYSPITKAIQFGVGTGLESIELGNSDYDFPDDMIEYGVEILMSILQNLEMS